MCNWVIIPVKPLNRAKSRLEDVLTPDQRAAFAEAMLRQVLAVVTDVPRIVGTLVVSRDTRALSIAREYGAKTVQESGTPELNPALMRATQVVRTWGCEAVLILPADLPFVRGEDIVNILDMGTSAFSTVIATDQHGDGTNALFVRPPGLFQYHYGPNSFQAHIQLARESGAEVHIYKSDYIALDVDLPEDLEQYNLIIQDGGFSSLPPFLPTKTVLGD